MADAVSSVVLLVGLAVGVDYSLFYLRREREERARGRSTREAIAIASATSGRAVIVSGLTVMIAMAGMLFAGDASSPRSASGSIIVVAVAMIGSVTVVPAVLAALGDRVERGRVPFLGKRLARRRDDGGRRVWGASSAPRCAARCSPRCSAAGCWSRSRSRRSRCTPRCRAPTTCRAASPS